MKKQKLYFAHPVNTYGEPIEIEMVNLIKRFFPQYNIENPNQPHHQDGYRKWKEKCGNGMKYFYEMVLPDCGAGCVMMPFLDGLLGTGVAGEGIWYLKKNMDVYLIQHPELNLIGNLTKKETGKLIEWDGIKEMVKNNKSVLETIQNNLVLSINHTRKRTWEILYKKIRKYEKAHLV